MQNCKMKQFPSVLVLHLERFELDYKTMCYRKNTSRVEIPLQLSVKVFQFDSLTMFVQKQPEFSNVFSLSCCCFVQLSIKVDGMSMVLITVHRQFAYIYMTQLIRP